MIFWVTFECTHNVTQNVTSHILWYFEWHFVLWGGKLVQFSKFLKTARYYSLQNFHKFWRKQQQHIWFFFSQEFDQVRCWNILQEEFKSSSKWLKILILRFSKVFTENSSTEILKSYYWKFLKEDSRKLFLVTENSQTKIRESWPQRLKFSK